MQNSAIQAGQIVHLFDMQRASSGRNRTGYGSVYQSGLFLTLINAAYHDRPLISIEAIRLSFEFIKAVSDTASDMINAAYHDKPLISIEAIRLSLSRLFLTLHLT